MSEFQGLYAIYDKKMNCFQSPFVCPNDAVAIRSLSDFLKSRDASLISNHPDDFALYKVAVWNSEKACASVEKTVVCECSDLMESHDEVQK